MALPGLWPVATCQPQTLRPVGIKSLAAQVDRVPARLRFPTGQTGQNEHWIGRTLPGLAALPTLSLDPYLDRGTYLVTPVRQSTPPCAASRISPEGIEKITLGHFYCRLTDIWRACSRLSAYRSPNDAYANVAPGRTETGAEGSLVDPADTASLQRSSMRTAVLHPFPAELITTSFDRRRGPRIDLGSDRLPSHLLSR